MGNHYRRLRDTERVSIMLMLEAGCGVNEIAKKLGRSGSTICREIRRQPYYGELPYEATRAMDQAHWSRWRCRNKRKLEADGALFATVAALLRRGWSPLQIAGRLRRMHGDDPGQRV